MAQLCLYGSEETTFRQLSAAMVSLGQVSRLEVRQNKNSSRHKKGS